MGLLTVSLAAVLYPFPLLAVSQAREQEAPEPPPFQLLRAEEDYGHLRYESRDRRGFLALIKFIQLNQDGSIYLTVGGEVRPRVEVFENRGWTEGSEAFYSQRLAVHAGLRLGSTFRIFGELYHGLLSKDEREIAQDDELDVHQAFLEITIPEEVEPPHLVAKALCCPNQVQVDLDRKSCRRPFDARVCFERLGAELHAATHLFRNHGRY